ncbi:MAG TPA: 1-phosphofructokinase family hexose kinase [Actinomycetes bacterium]|nr:1-phosphofructokinase family hexose kinase [Actinomycetes bacterium]
MILTVTLNPALDTTYAVDTVIAGSTHRVRSVEVRAGGKGLNVTRVLAAMGVPVLATGLIGGDNGDRIEALLAADGIAASFQPIAGESRRTVVATDGAEATGFWEPGPRVSATEWNTFVGHYRWCLNRASIVVLAGSLPPGIADRSYAELISLAREAGTGVVLDTEGPALRRALFAGPTVVKPNRAELSAATARSVTGVADAVGAARSLRDGSATAVVATLGADGMVASTANGHWHAHLPAPLPGNPTGAGDACSAALAAGLLRGSSGSSGSGGSGGEPKWPELLVEAVAWSAAAVAAPAAGMVDPDRIQELRPAVAVEEI